ncbi:hypothetical protein [Stakelama marina]|uniref:Tetratricopeptide repeat protein n=1 Tax=Stakelama marina TaxID=2826939 RepID=A0A8T4IF22_9SPHN|nr:hypothetical protein [Stakelama marina]MBR0553061.1 hypothetical protein [Stakelama marina]
MNKHLALAIIVATGLLPGSLAIGATPRCSFPHGDKTSVNEMIASIKRTKAVCALPWRALKSAVQDPAAIKQLQAAYDAIIAKYPDHVQGATARRSEVDAAAGHPEKMLAIADANVKLHPEDKTLSNMSCFARGRYGFDVANAMPYCNAAVANGRPGYALVNRGRVELETGQNEAAFADFNEAMGDKNFQKHFMLVDAVYGRGIARLRLGDEGGSKDIKAAIHARPTIVKDFEDGGVYQPDDSDVSASKRKRSSSR